MTESKKMSTIQDKKLQSPPKLPTSDTTSLSENMQLKNKSDEGSQIAKPKHQNITPTRSSIIKNSQSDSSNRNVNPTVAFKEKFEDFRHFFVENKEPNRYVPPKVQLATIYIKKLSENSNKSRGQLTPEEITGIEQKRKWYKSPGTANNNEKKPVSESTTLTPEKKYFISPKKEKEQNDSVNQYNRLETIGYSGEKKVKLDKDLKKMILQKTEEASQSKIKQILNNEQEIDEEVEAMQDELEREKLEEERIQEQMRNELEKRKQIALEREAEKKKLLEDFEKKKKELEEKKQKQLDEEKRRKKLIQDEERAKEDARRRGTSPYVSYKDAKLNQQNEHSDSEDPEEINENDVESNDNDHENSQNNQAGSYSDCADSNFDNPGSHDGNEAEKDAVESETSKEKYNQNDSNEANNDTDSYDKIARKVHQEELSPGDEEDIDDEYDAEDIDDEDDEIPRPKNIEIQRQTIPLKTQTPEQLPKYQVHSPDNKADHENVDSEEEPALQTTEKNYSKQPAERQNTSKEDALTKNPHFNKYQKSNTISTASDGKLINQKDKNNLTPNKKEEEEPINQNEKKKSPENTFGRSKTTAPVIKNQVNSKKLPENSVAPETLENLNNQEENQNKNKKQPDQSVQSNESDGETSKIKNNDPNIVERNSQNNSQKNDNIGISNSYVSQKTEKGANPSIPESKYARSLTSAPSLGGGSVSQKGSEPIVSNEKKKTEQTEKILYASPKGDSNKLPSPKSAQGEVDPKKLTNNLLKSPTEKLDREQSNPLIPQKNTQQNTTTQKKIPEKLNSPKEPNVQLATPQKNEEPNKFLRSQTANSSYNPLNNSNKTKIIQSPQNQESNLTNPSGTSAFQKLIQKKHDNEIPAQSLSKWDKFCMEINNDEGDLKNTKNNGTIQNESGSTDNNTGNQSNLKTPTTSATKYGRSQTTAPSLQNENNKLLNSTSSINDSKGKSSNALNATPSETSKKISDAKIVSPKQENEKKNLNEKDSINNTNKPNANREDIKEQRDKKGDDKNQKDKKDTKPNIELRSTSSYASFGKRIKGERSPNNLDEFRELENDAARIIQYRYRLYKLKKNARYPKACQVNLEIPVNLAHLKREMILEGLDDWLKELSKNKKYKMTMLYTTMFHFFLIPFDKQFGNMFYIIKYYCSTLKSKKKKKNIFYSKKCLMLMSSASMVIYFEMNCLPNLSIFQLQDNLLSMEKINHFFQSICCWFFEVACYRILFYEHIFLLVFLVQFLKSGLIRIFFYLTKK